MVEIQRSMPLSSILLKTSATTNDSTTATTARLLLVLLLPQTAPGLALQAYLHAAFFSNSPLPLSQPNLLACLPAV